MKAQSYFDLASTFTVGDHYNFRLGVNNIFDKNPPLFTSSFGSCAAVFCNGNTYPGVYDKPRPLLLRRRDAQLLSVRR